MRDTFDIRPKGDREIEWTRLFNAPAQVVFDAHTKPELVQRWLLGPDGWTMPVCEIDLRPGGKFRWVWRRESTGEEMGMSGTYYEIDAPRRIVHGERFDQPWYPDEARVTSLFQEENGKTRLVVTMQMATSEARDGVLKSGMESGVKRSYDRLDEMASEMAAA